MPVFTAVNLTTRKELGKRIRKAVTFFQRTRGLLGRKEIKKDEGLYIPACRSIHTFFMSFPIDVVFIDNDNRITRVVPSLLPFRIAFGPQNTAGVLELPPGMLKHNRCVAGDKISFIPMRKEPKNYVC
ncbi:MAG: DUF192 domain-containing protein [Deltaproteobacteria bacterium]|nr:DUF192 domain-containing protein [Deltaproteobacteria bacterium]NNK85567.1 DUF192 domain-containing protein [Desulfobacterales bacterium]